MPIRVAINGFGRIGRGMVRALAERDLDLDLVAVNDVADPDTLAHLLRYDSIYGRFPAPVRAHDGVLEIGDQAIRALAAHDPGELPWAELGVDGVETPADVAAHLLAGADVVMTTSALLRHGPGHARVLLDGLSAWMARKGFRSPGDFRGRLAVPAGDGTAYERAGYVSALRAANAGPHAAW